MPMTTSQLAILKAAILADQALNSIPNTADGDSAIADALNAQFSPNYWVWDTQAIVAAVFDQVTWANYTPNDAPDNTTTYQNRCMLIQIKQVNLQLMLQGRDRIDASRGTVRTGLNDATTNLPSGAGGALRSGGWNGIASTIRRKATYGEKIFAVAATGAGNDGIALNRGTTTNPDNLGYDGMIYYPDIQAARAS